MIMVNVWETFICKIFTSLLHMKFMFDELRRTMFVIAHVDHGIKSSYPRCLFFLLAYYHHSSIFNVVFLCKLTIFFVMLCSIHSIY